MAFVRDFLEFPAAASLDDFIVKPETKALDLVRQYTLTSRIRPKLSNLLREIEGAQSRNADIGRFIFGSFGSGKSHFLRIAGLLLGNDPLIGSEARDPALCDLRAEHGWLDSAALLVVSINMMTAGATADAFTRQLTVDFDRRLEELGQEPLRAFGTREVFRRFDEFCARVPETFAHFEKEVGYDRVFYEQQRAAAAAGKDVLSFARDVARFYGGEGTRFEPTDGEAREQMAAHAAKLGYRGLAFVIDEFVLWAQSLTSSGYSQAVNALNALVESADLRPLRFIVVAAIQRSITTVFPDDRNDQLLREQLARAVDRFPQMELEDSNLFEIAERRVLVPRPDRKTDWQTDVARIARELADAEKGVLVGDEPSAALAQLYPFHPALMRVLSDVTQGLHRDRSALYMLYQLLTVERPDLPMGRLMSLGALWNVLFSDDNMSSLETYAPKSDPTHHANRLLKTFHTWERLRASIAAVATMDRDRAFLDLAVKSALLAHLSHRPFLDETRGLDRATTIENLFRLNRADNTAMNETVGVLKLIELFGKLAAAETGTVVLDGTGPATFVRIELNAIDLSELLVQLRPPNLFATMLARVKDALGFSPSSQSDTPLKVSFRNTERLGRVRFESFEQLSYSGRASSLAREGGDEFKLAIVIESEFSGSAQQTIDNVRARIASQRDHEQGWAAAWLPAPLSTEGREALETLAKTELFEARPDDYLGRFRTAEHQLVRQRIGAMKIGAQNALRVALQQAYGNGARVETLRREMIELRASANVDVTSRAKLFGAQLLERRYPQHPPFGGSPNVSQLNKLLALNIRLLGDSKNNTLHGDEDEVAKKIGEPLELFEPGFGVTNLRTNGTYLDRLREWVTAEKNVGRLTEKLAQEPFGLQKSVAQALIAIVASRDNYRLVDGTRPRPIESIADVAPAAVLARGSVVSLAVWNGARNVAEGLFGLHDIPQMHTVGSADFLIAALRAPLIETLTVFARCVDALRRLSAVDASLAAPALVALYGGAERDLRALQDDRVTLSGLAALDVSSFLTARASANVDAPALENLADFQHLQSVLHAAPDLRAELQGIVASTRAPIASACAAWRERASKWIAARLAGRGDPPPPRPPEPPAGGSGAARAITREISFEASTAGELDAGLAKLRALAVNGFGAAGDLVIEARIVVRRERE